MNLTFVIPMKNAAPWLDECLSGVLGQTFRDFEVLLLDDGSTDESVAKAKTFSDRRLHILPNEGEPGLVGCLNYGISQAATGWIVRMDADDTCSPLRLEKQLRYLDAHPDIDVLGSCGHFIGAKSGFLGRPETSAAIAARIPFSNPMLHNSVMLPKNLAVYDSRYRHAEDYGLWATLLAAGKKFANVPADLVGYRIHAASVTQSLKPEQLKARFDAADVLWKKAGRGFTPEEKAWLETRQLSGFDVSAQDWRMFKALQEKAKGLPGSTAFERLRFMAGLFPRPSGWPSNFQLALALAKISLKGKVSD